MKRRPGRPRMTRKDYFKKYRQVIFELMYMEKSLRRISRDNNIGLSTVVRIKKKMGL